MIWWHSQYDTIIHALSHQWYMSASQLLSHCQTQWLRIWRAQLYKILRHLQSHKIVYKNKTLYTLHSKYIQSIKKLSDRIQRFTPLTDNITITLSCFLEINQAWPYYAYQIWSQSHSVTTQYKYCRHRTYLLSWRAQQPHQPQYEHLPLTQYILSNQTTYLDTYTLSLKRENVIQKNKDCNLFDFQWYNCNIIGDYILQTFVWPQFRQSIQHIYDTTTDIQWFDYEAFRQLFLIKEPCTLVITKSPQQAQQRRTAIQQECTTP